VQTRFIEATNGPQNWGKFMIGVFDADDASYRSAIDPDHRLISGRGWSRDHFLMLDLQTGEGGIFARRSRAHFDLEKHAIWVCPLYEPTLQVIMDTWDGDLASLPAHVDLPEVEFQWSGYRRPGPDGG
jgi:hypothetical protein